MAVVLFLLGRPGSGKSQVARCIKGDESPTTSDMEERCLPEDWKIVHITDYKHLLQMFREEEERESDPAEKCFEPSNHGGFDVTSLGFSRAVLDEALKRVNANILQEVESKQPGKQKLILVEFARNNYDTIKNVFDAKILANAFVLYLQADPELCSARVHQRASSPRWEDDSFVSDDILEGYYKEEDLTGLQGAFGEGKIKYTLNNDEWNSTWIQIKDFVREICMPAREGSSRQRGEGTVHFSASSSTELSPVFPFLFL